MAGNLQVVNQQMDINARNVVYRRHKQLKRRVIVVHQGTNKPVPLNHIILAFYNISYKLQQYQNEQQRK